MSENKSIESETPAAVAGAAHGSASDTPRTDRLEYEQECNFDVCWEDLCRELERENTRMREALQTIAATGYNNRSHQTMRDAAKAALTPNDLRERPAHGDSRQPKTL